MNGNMNSQTRQRLVNFVNSPRFEQLNPETQRRVQDFLNIQIGEIRRYRPLEAFGARAQRIAALTERAVLGDIPYLRRILPPETRQVTPFYPFEKAYFPTTRTARDIAMLAPMYRGVRRIPAVARLTTQLARGGPIARMGVRAIPSGIVGGMYGALTAATERPAVIAASAGLSSLIFPAFELGAIPITRAGKLIWRKALQPGIQNIAYFFADMDKEAVRYAIEKGPLNIINRKRWSEELSTELGHRMKIGANTVLNTLREQWKRVVNPILRNYRNTINWQTVKNQADDVFREFGIIDPQGKIRPPRMKGDPAYRILLRLRNDLRRYKANTITVNDAVLTRQSFDRTLNKAFKDNLFLDKDVGALKRIRRIINNEIHTRFPSIASTDAAFTEMYDAFDLIDIDWNNPKKVDQLARTIDKFPALGPMVKNAFRNVERKVVEYGGQPFIDDMLAGSYGKEFKDPRLRAVRTWLIGSLFGGWATQFAGIPLIGTLGATISSPRGWGTLLRTGAKTMRIARPTVSLMRRAAPPVISKYLRRQSYLPIPPVFPRR